MKTLSHIYNKVCRKGFGWRNRVLALFAAVLILVGVSGCGPAHSYWGVDQSYPVGNGHVYYGAHGGGGPHYDKKHHKKMRKQREKYLKKQRKEREKYLKKQRKHNKKHRHHDD